MIVGQHEPPFPILSIDEFVERGEIGPDGLPPDLRDQLSEVDRQYLDPADRVVHITKLPPRERPAGQPSALREMLRLTNNLTTAPVASLSRELLTDNDDPSLHKYEVIHGRDALQQALDLCDYYPQIMRSTLLTLAETQGTRDESYLPGVPFGQEEIGQIILLNRPADDQMGNKFSKRLNWAFPFYGSVDATLTFISSIKKYTTEHEKSFLQELYTTKDDAESCIQDALDRSVQWLIKRLDSPESNGFIEFKNIDPKGGIDAQSWRDSAYAYLHADGRRANHRDGVASVEVQALAYDALLDAAVLYEPINTNLADNLRARANTLRSTILSTFWVEDPEKGGYFALAQDKDDNGNPRLLRVRSSSMGCLLNSRLLEKDDVTTKYMRDSVVQQLFSPGMLSPFGIRTLANDEVGYRHDGYHIGRPWPKETGYVAQGLIRHGYPHLGWNLRERSWRANQRSGLYLECLDGDSSDEIQITDDEVYVYNENDKVLYLWRQPPQEIQGWTVSGELRAKYEYPTWQKNKELITPHDLERAILSNLTY